MSNTKNGAPEQTVTPHLVLKNSTKAIEFYKKAFGAEELCCMNRPDGGVLHAAIRIGDSNIFLCDEMPGFECGVASVETLGKATATMHVFVADVDAAYKRAVDAGATSVMEPQDMFWGDRYGRVVDPFGQPWSLAMHKETLTPEQMKERAAEACKQMAAAKK